MTNKDHGSGAPGSSRKAIVTGIRGQDATLLANDLRGRGWDVLGIDRCVPGVARTEAGVLRLDLSERAEVERLVESYRPDCVYHLAAAHHSSEQAGDLALDEEMVLTNFRAAENWLLAITRKQPGCRLLLAGSSQMYRPGPVGETLVNEGTEMCPTTLYGQTKAWSRDLLEHYRRYRGVFGSMVILFNHESPLRSARFLSRKVTMAAARAAVGQPAALQVRNIHAAVDWSSAQDFVEAMSRALAASAPADYVLASGRATKVWELIDMAFQSVNLDWHQHMTASRDSTPVQNQPVLVGDSSRARQVLAWEPREPLRALISRMVEHDVRLLDAMISSRKP